jgi:Ca2+-binding EF-hand superfamily protein
LIFRSQLELTRHQLAEIQLEGLLNSPELSLPIFNDDTAVFKLDDVAFRQQSKPWFVMRLICALGLSNIDFLNMRDVHTITRVLTGSFDARVLLFFNMIDTDGDLYVTRSELLQFFKDYTDSIDTCNTVNEAEQNETGRAVILSVILKKFRLDEASNIDFNAFYKLIIYDKLLIDTISRFTVHQNW